MIKLTDLLLEILPKQKWVRLKGKELESHSKDIWAIIKRTYTPIGGHPTYKSEKDITTDNEVKVWYVYDVDGDGDVDATIGAQIRKKVNVKLGMSATDGTKPAKRALVKKRAELVSKSGYFVETSGRPAEISIEMGLHIVTDKKLIYSMLDVNPDEMKDFKWLKDGWYQRRLRDGKLYKKIMIGFPKG